ncbi:tetratricopeptide repeat protein [Actinomadura fibrosa]|uniref:Tetratricopeptide repeat protein n=1 Tax=Actinomadura fibrosa TaxID=111802 RepID=A0ABW2XXK1_9ACTN
MAQTLVRRLLTAGLIAAMIVGLTLAATVRIDRRAGAPDASPAAGAAGAAEAPAATLSGSIDRLQRHLRDQPRDAAAWASLGLAYVERARLTADPSYYPKAAAVLDRSAGLRPDGNDAAHAGRAALAAARHDFPAALAEADRSLAVNPYGQRALAVRVDALVELGRYREAEAAVRHADATKPGIPVFTRFAYVHELHGRTGEARRVLELAAGSATDPADVAYVRTQLGELAWNRGDARAAGREFAAALRADPTDLGALDGRARVRYATGDTAGAIRDGRDLVTRSPLPGRLTWFGELLESQGRADEAAKQYAVARAWSALAQANGVTPDLETALFETGHGDRAAALRAARAEWARRRSVHVADALAWALHANGRDEEALGYARKAAATGYRNAAFLYHRGMIERSLGKRPEARRDLAAALRLNPRFSPLDAPRAKAALAGLGGAR